MQKLSDEELDNLNKELSLLNIKLSSDTDGGCLMCPFFNKEECKREMMSVCTAFLNEEGDRLFIVYIHNSIDKLAASIKNITNILIYHE